MRAERSVIPNSTENFRRDQGYEYIVGCNGGEKSTIIGTLMEIENCQIRGQASLGSRY